MVSLFLIIGLVIYLVVLVILLIRIIKLHRGEVYIPRPKLATIIEPKIDKLAYQTVVFSKEATHYGYILILLIIEKIIKLVKRLVIKIEKKFTRIINQVRGRGQITKKGAVSLFLREIKDHKDKIKSELNEKY